MFENNCLKISSGGQRTIAVRPNRALPCIGRLEANLGETDRFAAGVLQRAQVSTAYER
jgi:hypothetical protein